MVLKPSHSTLMFQFIYFMNFARAAVQLPDFSATQDIGLFISQLYKLSLSVVGIIVFVRFVYAGFLYLTAAGNANNVGRANSIMLNAVLGAVLLFSAYLLLYVINPDLVCNTFNFSDFTGSTSLSDCP